MNINTAFDKTPYVDARRNSDPDPEWWKEERLDGVKVWPKQIDPLTQRPVAVIYRHELSDPNADTES